MNSHQSFANEDKFYLALVVATSVQPPAPAEDLILIDKLKAKSGLMDVEFFIFTDKDIFQKILENLEGQNPIRDYFTEEAKKQNFETNWFTPAYQRYDGNVIAILSSKAFNELTSEEKEGLKGVSYSMVIAHELGHSYMRHYAFRVLENVLDLFQNDETRQKVEYIYGEFFANNFVDLLLSEKPLSPKNMADIFRRTRNQII